MTNNCLPLLDQGCRLITFSDENNSCPDGFLMGVRLVISNAEVIKQITFDPFVIRLVKQFAAIVNERRNIGRRRLRLEGEQARFTLIQNVEVLFKTF